MNNAQWHDNQCAGNTALHKWEREREQARKLVDALRASDITTDDCRAVEMIYAVAGNAGSYRIVEAMRSLRTWLVDGTP